MALGMQWSEISLSDVGPIEQGTVGNTRVIVFLGPNNSGKSITSRMIYGLGQLGDHAPVPSAHSWLGNNGYGKEAAASILAPVLIAENAGISIGDVATHGKARGRIVVKEAAHSTRFLFERDLDQTQLAVARMVASEDIAPARDTAYVPAGRTGIMQSLLSFMQIKNDLLNAMWLALNEGPAGEGGRPPPPKPPKPQRVGRRRQRVVPKYLERFNDLVLEAMSRGLAGDAQDMFSKLFGGSVESDDSYAPPQIYYRDKRGFVTKIDSAGSGTVSSFPIIASIDRIEPGGTLIIEEPEAHIEPLSQQRMISEVVRMAKAKNASLLFTTHSEYVVYPLLSMVSHGDLKRDDLGLYYFNRKPDSYTTIEKIDVSEEGRVDRELFEEALDALGTRV